MEGNEEYDAVYDEAEMASKCGYNDYFEVDRDDDMVNSADECDVVTEVEPGIEIDENQFLNEMRQVIERRLKSWQSLTEIYEDEKIKDGNKSVRKRKSVMTMSSGKNQIKVKNLNKL